MSRLRFLLSCSLVALLTACIDSTPVCGRDLCEDRDPVVRADGGVEPLACASLQERALELRDSYQACETDADCALASVEAQCLGAFACSISVARSANLEALQREAAALASEALSCRGMAGGSCVMAKCVAPFSLRVSCDRESQRCSAKYDPTLKPPRSPIDEPTADAGTEPARDAAASDERADAAVDATAPSARDAAADGADPHADAAAADAASIDPRFACSAASDCAVKNVGNCCGYYPRCANVDAVFTPPDCSGGQVGVCGWPEITSCDCRANTCVSLQDGKQI